MKGGWICGVSRRSTHSIRSSPTKVTRLALQNAASVAGLLLTTEVMIAESPKEEEHAHAGGGGGGMGGMGGMDM